MENQNAQKYLERNESLFIGPGQVLPLSFKVIINFRDLKTLFNWQNSVKKCCVCPICCSVEMGWGKFGLCT